MHANNNDLSLCALRAGNKQRLADQTGEHTVHYMYVYIASFYIGWSADQIQNELYHMDGSIRFTVLQEMMRTTPMQFRR